MDILAIVKSSIGQAVSLLGDTMLPVQVAAPVPFDPPPGQDYTSSWVLYGGFGFFDNPVRSGGAGGTTLLDYPGTEIQIMDRVLVLLECPHDVDVDDFVMVGDATYHVYNVRPDMIGNTRILQNLLLRPEPTTGIAWVSQDPSVV